MLFSPRNYNDVNEMRLMEIIDAYSDTSINNIDVFGYVEGTPYNVSYEMVDYDAGHFFVVAKAGNPITETEESK